MFKIVYYDGTELELNWRISLKRAITEARKNPKAWKIQRVNGLATCWERGMQRR